MGEHEHDYRPAHVDYDRESILVVGFCGCGDIKLFQYDF